MTRNLEVKTEKERWNPGGLPKIRTRLYRVLILLLPLGLTKPLVGTRGK